MRRFSILSLIVRGIVPISKHGGTTECLMADWYVIVSGAKTLDENMKQNLKNVIGRDELEKSYFYAYTIFSQI